MQVDHEGSHLVDNGVVDTCNVCILLSLQEDDFVLSESATIMRYLAKTRRVSDHWYPSKPKLPIMSHFAAEYNASC